jgi:hypothetical protein
MECQRNGTAVPSLATEYLQEVDHLSGIERQQAAQTITDTLGSMFQGKSPAFSTNTRSAYVECSAGTGSVRVLLHSPGFSSWLTGNYQTISSMSSLFFALILFPEVQKRAQAELDSVISRERLPTYDDKPRLPYIEAISQRVVEVAYGDANGCGTAFRFSTALCNLLTSNPGIPHAPTEDDFYKGYFIPKGLYEFLNLGSKSLIQTFLSFCRCYSDS